MADMNVANMAAYLGSAIAMGLGAIGSGWGIGYVGVGAARGIAKQPSQNSSLFRGMLIGQAVASNPSIFALVIALILYSLGGAKLAAGGSLAQAAAYLAAGISVGLGSLGSGAGNGLVASDAVEAMARCPKHSGKVTIMMVVGQAMGQTPVLFSLVVSFMLIYGGEDYATLEISDQVQNACRLLGMGICMGAGALGPGLGSSYIGGKFCEGLAKTPEIAQKLNNTYFVGAGVSQSTAIYAFVISLLLFTA